MRKLKTKDIFPFCRLVKALGIRDEIKSIAARANNINDAKALAAAQFGSGFDLIFNLFERAASADCEDAVYSLIASLLDVTMDEAKDVEIDALTDVLKEIVDGNSFLGFFKSAAAAMR